MEPRRLTRGRVRVPDSLLILRIHRALTTTTTVPPTASDGASTTGPSPGHYLGTGNLLVGTCATPEFTLVDTASALYYAPFVGCVADRADCCPFPLPASTGRATTDYDLPTARETAQATLAQCPSDYWTVSGGCCPRYEKLPTTYLPTVINES